MTMGTAMVASTNVRTTGFMGRSQSPRPRLITVRVGNKASPDGRRNSSRGQDPSALMRGSGLEGDHHGQSAQEQSDRSHDHTLRATLRRQVARSAKEEEAGDDPRGHPHDAVTAAILSRREQGAPIRGRRR